MGTKVVFIQKLVILVKLFGKNFIFRVKSTNILFFQDQMYIFGYKTTVFIQNLYILVNFFGKNFVFRVKSTIFWFFRTKCTFLGTTLHFYPKFVHFSEIIWQKLHFYCKKYKCFGFRKCTFLGTKLQFLSKICTFFWNFLAKTSFLV